MERDMGFESIGKLLLLGGVFLAALGLLLIFWQHIPFLGRLPGDIFAKRGSVSFYFPLATSIVLSILLTVVVNLVLWLLRR